MNEQDNKRNMMYGNNQAVTHLNKVPGFDPLQFLRPAISEKTQEKLMKLDLRYQKLWFRLAHPQGRMNLTALRITDQMAIFEAKVFFGPERCRAGQQPGCQPDPPRYPQLH